MLILYTHVAYKALRRHKIVSRLALTRINLCLSSFVSAYPVTGPCLYNNQDKHLINDGRD